MTPQGINLRSDPDLTPDVLSDALVKTVAFLQSIEPQASGLWEYADWWEHDGLHFAKGSLDFAALVQKVASPSTLLKAMPGDFSVFIGIAPQDFSWYLRFYLEPDPGEDESTGRFDLTLQPELMERYKKEVVEPLRLEIQEQEAHGYYQSIRS